MRQHVRYLLALISVMGCGHTDPFTDPDNTEDGPFAPGTPLKLTYNVGFDGYPFYLLGDSSIAYAFQRPGTTNQNQCFGVLPAGGGTTLSESCPRTAASLDSTERFEVGLPLTADSVLLLQVTRFEGRATDDFGYIGRALWSDATTTFSSIQRFPIRAPTGSIEFTPSHMALTGDGNIGYLATSVSSACPGFSPICDFPLEPISLVHGLEIGQVPLSGGTIQVLSGTDLATSMDAGRSPGSVVFTLPLDSRVYEREATGAIAVLVDMQGFAARDVRLRGDSVLAVTGGSVGIYTLPDGRQVQSAGPGSLSLARISTGQVSIVAADDWSRPAFSNDGTRIVAQFSAGGADDVYVVTP